MAWHISGSTDKVYWVDPLVPSRFGTVAFFMRSTSVVTNAMLASYWSGTSRSGWGVLINNTAGKVLAQGYDISTNRLSMSGATTVNDGNPHHVALIYDRNGQFSPGTQSSLYVDGSQDATPSFSSGDWVTNSGGFFYEIGKNTDNFWGAYVGDVWAFAHWNVQLSAADVAALAKGYSPKLIRRDALLAYAPLVSGNHEIHRALAINTSSGTVSPVGRLVGGAI